MDLSLERIEASLGAIDPVFLNTPQFVSDRLSGATAHIFVAPDAPAGKVRRMQALGARIEVREHPASAAREHAAESDDRFLAVDGLDPAIAEGAGTIGIELAAAGQIDTAVIQLGDGALITGVSRWLKSRGDVKVVGVCASGAPAMAQSFAARHAISNRGTGTIAGALAITDPIPESFSRILELVDEVLLVDDEDIRAAMALIADSVGVLAEPAGAAGIAAVSRHSKHLAGERVAVLLTGAAA